jgi:hypothetical protein
MCVPKAKGGVPEATAHRACRNLHEALSVAGILKITSI